MIEQSNGISAIKKRLIPRQYPNSIIENTLKKTNLKFWKAKALKFDTKCFGNKETNTQEALDRIKQVIVDMNASKTSLFLVFNGVARIFLLFSMICSIPYLAEGNLIGAVSPALFVIISIFYWI